MTLQRWRELLGMLYPPITANNLKTLLLIREMGRNLRGRIKGLLKKMMYKGRTGATRIIGTVEKQRSSSHLTTNNSSQRGGLLPKHGASQWRSHHKNQLLRKQVGDLAKQLQLLSLRKHFPVHSQLSRQLQSFLVKRAYLHSHRCPSHGLRVPLLARRSTVTEISPNWCVHTHLLAVLGCLEAFQSSMRSKAHDPVQLNFSPFSICPLFWFMMENLP